MSALPAFLAGLRPGISSEARILTDPANAEFVDRLLRWSEIDSHVPAAIILAGTEEDVGHVVKLAVEQNIPFVAKSGGHSLWSTIDSSGVILDLSLLKKIEIDKDTRDVTVQSGVLIKEANEAAFEAGVLLTLGTANTAGVIPMVLGGGLSLLASKVSYGSDAILRARLVTATGELIEVSDTSNPDLFWAIRGAGQHFGIVTSLTLQSQPLSILESDDATVWNGAIIFTADRAKELSEALAPILNDPSGPTCGLILVASPPPAFNTVLIVMPFYFGTPAAAEKHWAPILALNPVMADLKSVPWPRVNDGIDVYCGKGQFKRFAGAGAHKFKPETLPQLVIRYDELKSKAPDAAPTAYAIEFNSYLNPSPPVEKKDTAYGHRDIKVWMELLSWYTNPDSHDHVFKVEQAALEDYRKANSEVPPAIYQNWSRDVPVEWRYRGEGRLEKLRELKKVWDAGGIFTREFL